MRGQPWGKKTRCLHYYSFMRDPAFLAAGRRPEETARGSHCLRKLEEKRGCLELDRMPSGPTRDAHCATCAENGQKSTCPKRVSIRFPNGTRVRIDVPSQTFCPTAATRWWVF